MGQQVGGLMTPKEVGSAFETLLTLGRSGDVMALWKDCPPYFIPDTSMGIFIAFTTGAMAFRFVPRILTPSGVRWGHMLTCLILFWVLMAWVWVQLTSLWAAAL